MKSFEALGLYPELLAAIKKQGYQSPTPIQQRVIPSILEGRNLIGIAQTGTGKTAGFTLPLLQCLSSMKTKQHASEKKKKSRHIIGLILTPTRELATQVNDCVKQYANYLPLKTQVIFGGVSFHRQIIQLKRGTDILVATPGRLLDLIRQGLLDLGQIEMIVLDEADRMLDMGFIHDIQHIVSLIPKHSQRLLFSATFSKKVKALTAGLVVDPVLIEIPRCSASEKRIKQKIYPVEQSRKRELLSYLIGSENWKQSLVFTKTKRRADLLTRQLEEDGLSATAIHSDKSQGARQRALLNFKTGKKRVLVATDVAARGLDIDKLPYVVNFDLPIVPEDYVHRIGRTGRASREGVAISLVSSEEKNLLKSIEKFTQAKLTRVVIPGYEVSTLKKSRPFRKPKAVVSDPTRKPKAVVSDPTRKPKAVVSDPKAFSKKKRVARGPLKARGNKNRRYQK